MFIYYIYSLQNHDKCKYVKKVKRYEQKLSKQGMNQTEIKKVVKKNMKSWMEKCNKEYPTCCHWCTSSSSVPVEASDYVNNEKNGKFDFSKYNPKRLVPVRNAVKKDRNISEEREFGSGSDISSASVQSKQSTSSKMSTASKLIQRAR